MWLGLALSTFNSKNIQDDPLSFQGVIEAMDADQMAEQPASGRE
jgi:hypothetical protein